MPKPTKPNIQELIQRQEAIGERIAKLDKELSKYNNMANLLQDSILPLLQDLLKDKVEGEFYFHQDYADRIEIILNQAKAIIK